MRKALLMSAALVLLSSPVMAGGYKHTNQGGDASASSRASAGASAGAHSSSGVYGSGNSSNRNQNSNRNTAHGGNAHQGQGQHQSQGQSQRNRVNNSDSVTVEGDDVDQEYYNVVTPSSAGNNQWECTQSYNGSVNVLFGGISFGVPTSDEVCELANLHKMAVAMNDKIAQEMAGKRLRDILQDRIGYKATVEVIQTTAAPGTSIAHKARPYWCEDRDGFGMSEADRKACGLI